MYDLIIIGAGPAGITAAVYAARKKMNFPVIAKDIGGQTALSGDIENYTGYQFITGPELTEKFEEHMKKYGIKWKENEEAAKITQKGGIVSVRTGKDEYRAKTAIIASGARWRELGVPGEKEFKNKGLTYCATCDGPLFAGRDVAVVGGGNSGLEATLQLMKIAKTVRLIEAASRLTGDEIMQDKAREAKNVTVLENTKVTAVLGEKMVSGIKVSAKGKEDTLALQGVFVEIGLMPNSDFAEGIDKNEYKEIKINSRNETNVPGIFAAGDVTDIPEKQIIIAAGEGSKAALSAFRYLARQK